MACEHMAENSGEMWRQTVDGTGLSTSVVTIPLLDSVCGENRWEPYEPTK